MSNHSASTGTAPTKRESPQVKLTPQQERGLRLLKAAEAEAVGLQPDMRAFVLWRVAYAYTKIDPTKAEAIAADRIGTIRIECTSLRMPNAAEFK